MGYDIKIKFIEFRIYGPVWHSRKSPLCVRVRKLEGVIKVFIYNCNIRRNSQIFGIVHVSNVFVTAGNGVRVCMIVVKTLLLHLTMETGKCEAV
jgi:hypothetical protein